MSVANWRSESVRELTTTLRLYRILGLEILADMNNDYQAILLVSFGGPEGMDDVIPFLENVLRGRNVPRERMLEVAEHYRSFGGVSPINQQNRDLISALLVELKEHGIELPVYFGNRNWHPMLPDTLREMKENGIERALAFFTSAFSSYSGCRQYRENIASAQETVGENAPQIEKVRHYFNHPGFVETMVDRIEEAKGAFQEEYGHEPSKDTRLVFTAHSIPISMAETSNYETQLLDCSKSIATRSEFANWDLVYQSRSGPPTQPWLEPDVCDHLESLKKEGINEVILVPVGFISDHMEVLFDLDTEAKDKAGEIGLELVRAKTAGTHPRFVSMIRELIEERLNDSSERPFVGELGPSHDVCPINCCPNPRPTRPARS